MGGWDPFGGSGLHFRDVAKNMFPLSWGMVHLEGWCAWGVGAHGVVLQWWDGAHER